MNKKTLIIRVFTSYRSYESYWSSIISSVNSFFVMFILFIYLLLFYGRVNSEKVMINVVVADTCHTKYIAHYARGGNSKLRARNFFIPRVVT